MMRFVADIIDVPIMDPMFGYEALNVETQARDSSSLLNWTKRMIDIRKRHPVFSLGSFDELNSSNPSVLAFVRERREDEPLPAHTDAEGSDVVGTDTMLCVNNLSKFPQPVELDLSRYAGYTPVECTGGVAFPPIGELSYLLTMPGHGFYWFTLQPPEGGHD